MSDAKEVMPPGVKLVDRYGAKCVIHQIITDAAMPTAEEVSEAIRSNGYPNRKQRVPAAVDIRSLGHADCTAPFLAGCPNRMDMFANASVETQKTRINRSRKNLK